MEPLPSVMSTLISVCDGVARAKEIEVNVYRINMLTLKVLNF